LVLNPIVPIGFINVPVPSDARGESKMKGDVDNRPRRTHEGRAYGNDPLFKLKPVKFRKRIKSSKIDQFVYCSP
jgi:hypothetical protein